MYDKWIKNINNKNLLLNILEEWKKLIETINLIDKEKEKEKEEKKECEVDKRYRGYSDKKIKRMKEKER